MIAGYFAIIGSLCLALSGWLFMRRLWVVLDGVTTEGTIAGYQLREYDESRCYLPTVSFTDAQGQTHSFTSVAGSRGKRPRPGSAVRIRYARRNPRIAFIDNFLHLWSGPLSLLILGLAGWVPYWQQ